MILIGMISQIKFINPNLNEYTKWNDKYTEYIKDTKNINLKDKEIVDYTYQLNKTGQVYFIVDIIVYIGYFVFFQKFNKGQTLGKKIVKIRILNKDNTSANISQLLIRSLLIYGIITQLSILLTINFVSKNMYLYINNIITFISTIIFWACAFVIIFRKDNQGLHDLLVHTIVVEEKNEKIIQE